MNNDVQNSSPLNALVCAVLADKRPEEIPMVRLPLLADVLLLYFLEFS